MPTAGYTAEPDYGSEWWGSGADNQHCTAVTMPEAGRITRIGVWLRGKDASCSFRGVVWNSTRNAVLGQTALQTASGAELWASAASARAIEAGGDDPDIFLPLRALNWAGITRYPAASVDHVFEDGDTVRVGPVVLTAHITGGHTRGCTSWSFVVHDGERALNVVSACSLVVLQGARYPEQRADIARTFRVLRGLPADIWVTSHARLWGRYRKFVASRTAANPVTPFIDPEGYRAYIDSGEASFRRGVVH
jgi:metallo-beta-lactamase class B